jgi:pyrrolysyl-tRNA synthetase-like protein
MNSELEKEKKPKEEKKRYVYKNQSLYALINKIKLWPSRTGLLHGIKSVVYKGKTIKIITHCGEEFTVWDSKNSRSARWVRNRWCTHPCPKCKVPEWKLSKYSSTIFTNATKK